MATAYELGYRDGRQAGGAKGKQDGRQRGYSNTLMPRALLIVPAIELPSLEIILLQPFRHLKMLGIHNFRVRLESEVKESDIQEAGIVIFLRNVEPGALHALHAAHKHGKRTVYVIDDNFLEIPPGTAVSEYYRHPDRRNAFQRFLRESSLVKVDSGFFANYIRLHFNPHVVQFPSSVDFSLVHDGEQPVRAEHPIVIGYEGTHKDADFAQVVPALLRVLDKYGDGVRLQFHGYMPAGLNGHPRVSHLAHQVDYRSYIRNLRRSGWHIGIAPLQDSMFNFCKTNNKFREYAACGIPGIYSFSPAYVENVVHGESGYLVHHHTEGWFQALCEMIENGALRRHIALNAYEQARGMFDVDRCAKNWREQVLHV